NVTRHYHRDRKRAIFEQVTAESENLTEPPPAFSQTDARASSQALHNALKRLSEVHREVLVLRYYEHFKIREIATKLGVSDGTVKSRLHYAIEELQRLVPAELNLFAPEGTDVVKRQ